MAAAAFSCPRYCWLHHGNLLRRKLKLLFAARANVTLLCGGRCGEGRLNDGLAKRRVDNIRMPRDAKSLLFRMLLKRLLKRAVVVALLGWAAFAWATGRIDPASGMARVYNVVAEKVGRKSRGEPAHVGQDAAATRAAASIKAAGIEPGGKPTLDAALAKGPYSANDVLCLAHAVYYEASRETREIQTGVAQVALNRVATIPGVKTICRIVYLGLGRPMGCMFSSTCRNLGTIPDDETRWRAAIEVAQDVAAGKGLLPQFEQATHFSASQIRPSWVSSVYKIGKIGRFTFYSTQPVEPPAGAEASAAAGGTSMAQRRAAAAVAHEENAALAARRKAANLPRTVSVARPASGVGSPAGTSGKESSGRTESRSKSEPRAAPSPGRSPFGDTFN